MDKEVVGASELEFIRETILERFGTSVSPASIARALADHGARLGHPEILQTDATVCGGVSEWRRIAATAASYGVTVSPHAWHDIHVHLAASASNARFVEFMPDDHIVNFRRLIDRQLVAEDGDLLLPQTPGLGWNFDPDKVAKYGARYPGADDVWLTVR